MIRHPDSSEPPRSESADRKSRESAEFVQVLSTFNPADVSILRSVLDTREVDYYIKGEHFSTWRPMIDPARLMVRRDQAEVASQILKDLHLSFVAITTPESGDQAPVGGRTKRIWNFLSVAVIIFVVIWILLLLFGGAIP